MARAIFEAKTPVISAVGHEVDFTIADFVADVRAATPSNGAELAVKSRAEYAQLIGLQSKSLVQSLQRHMLRWRNRVKVSETHPIFVRVRSRINDCQRRLADLDSRAQRRLTERFHDRRLRLARAGQRLQPERMRVRGRMLATRLAQADADRERALRLCLERAKAKFEALVLRLDDLSPLKILARGYAVAFDSAGRAIKKPADARFGEVIRVRLAQDEIHARVIEDQSKAVQQELF